LVLSGGWIAWLIDVVNRLFWGCHSLGNGALAVPPIPDVEARLDLGYWKHRLVPRAYGQAARPRFFPEFSVPIDHEGLAYFFPLGTHAKGLAAARALEIYRTVLSEGWPKALERYCREFTLAIFWAEDPMVFTYSTLYTVAEQSIAQRDKRRKAPAVPAQVSIAVAEPDHGCQQALAQWINALPGCVCAASFNSGADALRGMKDIAADLLLFNRQLPDLAAGELGRTLQQIAPAVPAFGYRIYPTSDELFVSQPGKSGGYYFRRRNPEHLLEPIQDILGKGSRVPADWHSSVCSYVTKLFRLPLAQKETSALTVREQDILNCLCQGQSDKAIAAALKISAWTVHTHLKKIYDKLGAHSRTEAVIRYLQK
jgi:two-component system NarL family response regulator